MSVTSMLGRVRKDTWKWTIKEEITNSSADTQTDPGQEAGI